MSSGEDDDTPKSGIRHHLLLRPAAEFPVTRVQHSLDSDSEELSEEDDIELPENTRQSWSLNKAWLQSILSEHFCKTHEELSILQFSVRSGSEPLSCRHSHETSALSPHESGLIIGDSALSEVVSVCVEYRLQQHDEKKELIIKLPPRDPVSRFFVTEAQFDLREIKFYTQVVPELVAVLGSGDNAVCGELPIPRCLHATYRAAPHHSVLVLDNLKARGYRGANFAVGLSLAETRAAIRALARVHALSLVLKVRDGADLPQRYPFLFRTSAATDSYQQLVERGLPQLARFLQRRGALDADAANSAGDYSDILDALTCLRSRTRSVIASLLAPREPLSLITHTDFWCSNLLFREATEGDESSEPTCAILDWQMITYSHPANDLALLIISSVDSSLRRTHTPALLDFYLACLAQQCAPLGVNLAQLGYTGAMLRDDFRRSQLLALLLCIGSIDVALGDGRTEERLLHVLKDLYEDGVLTDTTLTADE